MELGESVLAIERHQAFIAHADWIIDLGPGAGHHSGPIVFESTPAGLAAARSTFTGEHLAAYVDAWPGFGAAGANVRTRRPLPQRNPPASREL